MDYYSMKRKQLQALCKQHNIPANSASSVLAHNLSQLLNQKQKPTTRKRTCLKTPVETSVEDEPALSNREAKKVRFSPNNELLEYELRSGKKQKDVVIKSKGQRKSVANKVELVEDAVQNPVRVTRSRVQVVGTDGVVSNNEKKNGKKAAKDVEKVNDVGSENEGNLGKVTRSKVHTLVAQPDDTKQRKREIKDVEKTNEVVEVVRVTRSKAQSLMDDGIGSDVNPQPKKSSGKRAAKDAHSVEPSPQISDIPVRVTRARGQTSKQDNGNTVTNPQGEKKRTRKEMKSTDTRINSSNVAPDDNQELPKRKSLRTRGVETVDEDETENLGRGKQKKRTKESVVEVPESQHHADKGQRQSRRNVAKIEDSEVSNQNVSKVEIVNDRRVTRSKHQRDSKLDQGEKKVVNRRKSVMQKVQGKEIDKPMVGKRESKKTNVMVESPTRETRRTVGKTRSKEQSGDLSLIDEGSDDTKNVTTSGTSANEMKAVVSPTGSPKSRKRRVTPIVEDQTVETGYVSPVDDSPKHSAPTSRKSERKTVSKKQAESSLKTPPASRKNKQLAVQNAFPEVNKENSSKKRANLSGTNQRYSESPSVKSSVKGTPVSKMGNFELDEEVTETESTPAIESHRRVTRSAVRTVGKEPGQSAIQDQPIGDAQFSSQIVARFRPNPAVNTAPGRVTRSGIKHGAKAAISFSEKIDKKKQASQSAVRKQRLDDTRISTPEGAQGGLNPDVDTIGVQSEISKGSESVKLPPVVPEENMVSLTGTAIVTEKLSPVSGENASGIESHTVSNIKMTPVIMAEKPEVYETTPDAISDGSHVQNETVEVSVKTAIFSEAEVQVALNVEKPVADENEMDLTKLGSTLKGMQIDLLTEEPATSVDKTIVMEEIVDIPNEAGSSAVSHVSVEQPDVKGRSTETEEQVEPSMIENATQSIEDDGSYTQIAKGYEQDDLTCKDSLQNDSVDRREVADNGEGDDEDQSASVQKPLMNEPVSADRVVADVLNAQKMDETDNKEEMITTGQSVNENGELSSDKSVVNCLAMDRSVEFEVVPSTDNDFHEVPVSFESDGKEDIVSAGQGVAEHGELPTGNDVQEIPILAEIGNKEDIVSAGQSDVEMSHEIPILAESDTKEDMVTAGRSVAKHSELKNGENVIYGFSMDRSDVADDIVDAGKVEDFFLSGNDGEDGSANATNCQIHSVPSTSGNLIEDPVLSNDMYDDVEADGSTNVPKELETGLEPPNVPVSINDDSSDFENNRLASNASHALDKENVGGEDSEPALNENTFMGADEVPCDTVGMCASVGPLDSEPAPNENSLVGADEVPCDTVGICASVGPSDSEPAPNENSPVGADEVPCDTVGICASVGPSDSLTNFDSPHTHATAALTVDPFEESILDINKDGDSNILGDTYDTHTENESGNELKFSELVEGVQPKESETFPSDMSKEQKAEKAETTTGNDHVLDDQEDHTVATVDLDLDGGKIMEDSSNHGVEERDSELVGIIKSDENPTREESSPIVQRKEYSSQVMGDIGAHESPITKGKPQVTYTHEESPLDDKGSDSPTFPKEDDRNKSVTANETDDVLDKSRKVSEFQPSVGASSYYEENSPVAADMVNSVKNLEMVSRNVTNEKSSQEVDTLNENVNADMTEDVFNWAGSSLAAATARISHVKDDEEDASRFIFPDDNNDISKNGTATHVFDHQWQMESLEDFDVLETHGNATTYSSENVTYGTIEDYTRKFFGDDSSDDGGKDMNLELKDDQVDRTKRFDFSSEAAGTSHFQDSGVKDNSLNSDELEKKDETKLKGLEPFDDIDFDKGI